MNDSFRAIALSALGLEKVLANELAKIGLEPSGRAPGRVYFTTDAAGLFRANLELRTAERVLLEAARYAAPDFDALFEGARRPDWERFLARDDKLVIERVRSRDSKLEAQTAIQSVVHKAIYESLGNKYRITRLPETGRERSLRVYLEGDECVLGLDLSGEALHRRGWRRSAGEAPLKETMAAGLLFLSGWKRRLPLLDPFCGVGTILIEAAHFALERAPGLDRHFDLESMPIAREGHASAFTEERQRAVAAVRKDVELHLTGRDTDQRAIDQARANAERAGVGPLVDFAVGRAEDLGPSGDDADHPGILLTNPPWGERLGTAAEADALYARLGKAWCAAPGAGPGPFAGWGLGFITNRQDFGVHFGRRAPVERTLVNGSEEQWFHWYPAGWEDRPVREAPRIHAPYKGRGQDSGGSAAGRGTSGPPRDRGSAPGAPRRVWVGPDKPGWRGPASDGGRGVPVRSGAQATEREEHRPPRRREFGASRSREDRGAATGPRGAPVFGDRPREDRPWNDRRGSGSAHGVRPTGDRAQGDRSRDDRPRGNRPRDDRPRDDRPRDDRPREGQRPGSTPHPEPTGHDRPRFEKPHEKPHDKPHDDRQKPGPWPGGGPQRKPGRRGRTGPRRDKPE